MDEYINKDLRKAISGFTVKVGKTKDGVDYTYLALTLVNGYEKRIFVQQAEQFAFNNAFELLNINNTIDSEF